MRFIKTTDYFNATRLRPDRAIISSDWILSVLQHPEKIEVQENGRIRYWARIPEAGGKVLRVVTLANGTVHNAFFDRGMEKKI